MVVYEIHLYNDISNMCKDMYENKEYKTECIKSFRYR